MHEPYESARSKPRGASRAQEFAKSSRKLSRASERKTVTHAWKGLKTRKRLSRHHHGGNISGQHCTQFPADYEGRALQGFPEWPQVEPPRIAGGEVTGKGASDPRVEREAT